MAPLTRVQIPIPALLNQLRECPSWSKELGLGPSGVDLHGFERLKIRNTHLPHQFFLFKEENHEYDALLWLSSGKLENRLKDGWKNPNYKRIYNQNLIEKIS